MCDRRLWILVLSTLLALRPGGAPAAERTARQVLIVYSHEREMAMYTHFDRALRTRLQAGADFPIEFYTEYLDLIRFADPQQRQKSVDFLRVKYSAQRVDLIIVVSSLAFDFIIEHGAEVFPNIPVVFTSVNISRVAQLTLPANVTGVAVKRNLKDTLDLLLTIHPDTQRVFVPVGSSVTERTWTADTRELLRPYETRVQLTYLGDLPMEAMLRQLETLPPQSAVLFAPLFYYDADGRYFLPEEALAAISERSSAPVYAADEAFLGSGMVGGILFDLAPAGDAAGRLGRRVLAGEKPADMPVETIDPNYPMFDARQLERWGISRSRLPAGSVIRFAEPRPWDRYKVYIIGATSLLALQAALIAGLVAARVRRLRAEASLRASHVQVRDLAGRLITAQEEERKRIARELHDDASQRIALLAMSISSIHRRIDDDPRQAHDEIAALERDVVALSNDLRALSHQLHPGLLEYLGLAKSLRVRCDEVTAQSGVKVRLDVGPEVGVVPPDTALCLYRVAQEALHNIVKHAHARSARVSLMRHDHHLALSIEDDGRGFDTGERSGHRGLGLISLDERVRMLGGTFAVTSAPQSGTTLSVVVPVGESESSV